MKEESRTNWASHVEWLTLMITIIGSVYVIDNKIDRQISEVRAEVNIVRADLRAEMQAQTERTDRLYEMFIELIKQKTSG